MEAVDEVDEVESALAALEESATTVTMFNKHSTIILKHSFVCGLALCILL